MIFAAITSVAVVCFSFWLWTKHTTAKDKEWAQFPVLNEKFVCNEAVVQTYPVENTVLQWFDYFIKKHTIFLFRKNEDRQIIFDAVKKLKKKILCKADPQVYFYKDFVEIRVASAIDKNGHFNGRVSEFGTVPNFSTLLYNLGHESFHVLAHIVQNIKFSTALNISLSGSVFEAQCEWATFTQLSLLGRSFLKYAKKEKFWKEDFGWNYFETFHLSARIEALALSSEEWMMKNFSTEERSAFYTSLTTYVANQSQLFICKMFQVMTNPLPLKMEGLKEFMLTHGNGLFLTNKTLIWEKLNSTHNRCELDLF